MNLNIALSDELGATLQAQAHAQGVSADDYAERILAEALMEADERQQEERRSSGTISDQDIQPTRRKHISEVIGEIMRDVPPEVMATMPTDGASEHDHYLYGWPKRNS